MSINNTHLNLDFDVKKKLIENKKHMRKYLYKTRRES
jgi:hypothetical protein